MVPLFAILLSRAARPHSHHNTAYHRRHIHLFTMYIYTAVVGAIAKTATLLSVAQLCDRVLTRLCESLLSCPKSVILMNDIVVIAVMLPLGAGIA